MNSKSPDSVQLHRLSCTNVPPSLLLKSTSKEYFSQFGRIVRMVLKPKSRVCIIEYDNDDSVQLALAHARDFNGHKFDVAREPRPAVKKKRTKQEEDPDWALDPDVQEELKAMGGNFGPARNYNLRPEHMQVDQVPEPVKQKEIIKKNPVKATPPLRKEKIVRDKEPVVKSKKTTSGILPLEQMELFEVLKQPAFTPEDKYKVLEARDKLIRLHTKKHTDLTRAKATVGTCPDMCPEKERLMRESQHQVALYEQETGGKGMNPSLAVKQYSRSSADQEVPLPHELRPVAVLKMTMEYLMQRIMNLCDTPDVNFAEWYHFLWDRTRGIRKDITQQELCCEGSVHLVEQCARFHIHCSARLVSEDPSVFDQKINTENLTKCLQTLKYMYHDLELQNVRCKNEAEFRAYIILLNLNDGNFMWEVQQLKPEIQKSANVKFALQVYSALDKNNYVKFFKLVRSTTYLNACILLRYFVQVRISAIKIILKGFSPRMPYKSYPLNELTDILAFENIESTIEFLEYHGLCISEDKTQVILDKRLFSLPELPYSFDRAVNVIESKRTSSVGETVCGASLSLTDFDKHVPQNSFAPDGFFNISQLISEFKLPLDSSTSTKTEEKKTIFKDSENETVKTELKASALAPKVHSAIEEDKERSRSPLLNTDSVDSKSIWVKASQPTVSKSSTFSFNQSSIFGSQKTLPQNEEKTLEIFKPPQQQTTTNIFAQKSSESSTQPKNIFSFSNASKPLPSFSFMQQETKIVEKPQSRDPRILKRQEELLRTKLEAEELAKKAAEKTEKLKKELEERMKFLAQQKMEENLRKQREELEKQEQLRKQQELLKKQQEEQLRREQEERIRREIEEQLKKQQEELRRQQELKKNLEIQKAVSETLEQLLSAVEEELKLDRLSEISENIRRSKTKKYLDIWREKVAVNRKRRNEIDISPAWLNSRTILEEAKELHTDSQDLTLKYMKRYKYGKPIELNPEEDCRLPKLDLHKLVCEVLAKSFSKFDGNFAKELFWKVTVSLPDSNELKSGSVRLEEILQDFINWEDCGGSKIFIQQEKGNGQQWNYCVERQKGLDFKTFDSNGCIFIAKNLNDTLCRRMTENLKGASKPVVVILEDYCDCDKLDELTENGFISSYEVFFGHFKPRSLIALIRNALLFLAEEIDKPPPLELDTLQSFLSRYLCADIWKQINSFSKWNSAYKHCLKDPHVAISVYNENLKRLEGIVSDEEHFKYSSFPEAFKDRLLSPLPEYLPCSYKYFPNFWKNERYTELLQTALGEFSIGEYNGNWPPENQRQLELDVYEYCTDNFRKYDRAFCKIMEVILKNADIAKDFSKIKSILWTDITEVVAKEKVLQADFAIKDGQFSRSIFNQIFVVYDVNTLNQYKQSSWFYVNHPVIDQKLKEILTKEQEPKPKPAVEFYSLDIDLDEMLAKVTNDIVENREKNVKRKREVDDLKRLMDDLSESFKIQKKINSVAENVLKSVLGEQK